MWISKKRFKEMEETQEDLIRQVNAIKKCHNFKENHITGWFDDSDIKIYSCTNLPLKLTGFKAQTKNIKDVTIQELAEYVLDDKPIKRESMVKVTKLYH